MSKQQYIIFYVVFAFVLGFLFTNIAHLYYLFMPASHWIEYHKVELVEPAYVGERLRFVSHRTVHNEVPLRFSNTLMCWDGDRGTYEYYLKHKSNNPSPEDGPATWYFDKTVNVEKSCYLETSVSLMLPYNIRKVISINSAKFNIEFRRPQR